MTENEKARELIATKLRLPVEITKPSGKDGIAQ